MKKRLLAFVLSTALMSGMVTMPAEAYESVSDEIIPAEETEAAEAGQVLEVPQVNQDLEETEGIQSSEDKKEVIPEGEAEETEQPEGLSKPENDASHEAKEEDNLKSKAEPPTTLIMGKTYTGRIISMEDQKFRFSCSNRMTLRIELTARGSGWVLIGDHVFGELYKLSETSHINVMTNPVIDVQLDESDKDFAATETITVEPGNYEFVLKTNLGFDYTLNIADITSYITSISIPQTINVGIGETAVIPVSNPQPSGACQYVKWSTGNTGAAKIDGNGKITGVAKGTAIITATLKNGISYSCYVYVESPKLNMVKLALIKGERKRIMVLDAVRKADWVSGNPAVAKVDENGYITAVGKGTTTIAAVVGNKKLTCRVTVETPEISRRTVSAKVGEKIILKVNGTAQKIKWSSANRSIATVDAKGVVTARKTGTTKITAKIGTGTYACSIRVQATRLKTTTCIVAVGGKKVIALNKKYKNVKWKSADKKIAVVNSKGEVTGKRKGNTVVYAVISGASYPCNIEVESPKISKKSVTLENKGTITLKVTGTKSRITWKSSNKKVAVVNSKGKVIGKNRGTATITANVSGKNLSCKVKVKPEKPKIVSYMNTSSNYNAILILVKIKNNGTKDLRMYSSGARLTDDISYYNRKLQLIDEGAARNNEIRKIDYLDIRPGETKLLVFKVSGLSTRYTIYSRLSMKFRYDGKNYMGVCSAYYRSYYR